MPIRSHPPQSGDCAYAGPSPHFPLASAAGGRTFAAMRLPGSLLPLLLLSLAAPRLARAETLVSENISQPDGLGVTPAINYTITNANPGAVFNSASLQYGAQFQQAFDYALAHNPSLQALGITSLAHLLSHNLVGVTINTAGSAEVYQGWTAAIHPTTGGLNLTHAPFGYHVWNNTFDNASRDTMTLTYHFGNHSFADPRLKNLFDLNGDGVVQERERVYRVGELEAAWGAGPGPEAVVAQGFEGVTEGGFYIRSDVPRYTLGGAWWERRVAAGRAQAAAQVERLAGQVRLRWQALGGLTYTAQRSLTLAPADFQDHAPPHTAATTGPAELTFPETAPHAFYRLKIERIPQP